MLAVSRRALNTERAYRFDWADFSGWCLRAGVSPLPATSDTLQLYCIDQARHGAVDGGPVGDSRTAQASRVRYRGDVEQQVG